MTLKVGIRILFIITLSFAFLQSYADSYQRQIELDFEPIEDATGYEIRVESKASKKTLIFKTKTATWQAKLKPGIYFMELRSLDQRGVPGPWSEKQTLDVAPRGPNLLSPEMNAQVQADSISESDVIFSWENISGTKFYRFELTDESGEKIEKIVQEPSLKLELQVAKSYKWRVFALRHLKDSGGESPTINDFVLLGKALEAPSISKPIDEFVQELTWSKPDYTESFSYVLESKQDDKWKVVQKNKDYVLTRKDFDLDLPGGTYRLRIKAEAKKRTSSVVAVVEFPVFNGKRDPASIEETRLKQSIENPSVWNLNANYLMTNVTYEGQNIVGNTKTSFEATGGSGKLGLSYLPRESAWGAMLTAEMSGMTVAGENITANQYDLHAMWRKIKNKNQLKASGGVFYKEMIEVKETVLGSKNYVFPKLSGMGLHLGADYTRALNYKYGMQLNARIYQILLTVDTPNSSDLNSTTSYQLGVMGSYRLTPSLIGFLGYAYRRDFMSYAAEGAFGLSGDQEVSVYGNYLNLALEWGF